MNTLSVLALAPLLPLGITLLNLATWRRGGVAEAAPRISVLIPARNEAHNIGAALEALVQSSLSPLEILVYDDHSTDSTAAIVQEFAARDGRIRLLQGPALPPGWVGKPFANAQLAAAARGEWLIYLDADVCITETGIAQIAFRMHRADLVTAVPRQRTEIWAERAVVPLLLLTYYSWFPLPLVRWSRINAFLAANGQILAVRADVLRAVGGWEAVRDAVVDDMALCGRVKRAGWRVDFADGHDMAVCRMYRSFSEVWEGFSKNIRLGLGSAVATVAVMALYAVSFLLQPVLLPWVGEPALVGSAAILLQRTLLARRHTQGVAAVLLHPVGLLLLLGIAANSVRWAFNGQVRWKGRCYAPGSELRQVTP